MQGRYQYSSEALSHLVEASMSLPSLQWRHDEHDCVSNHQPHNCLLSLLFWHRSKKASKLCVTGLCAGNSPVTGEFPAQRASNAENVSIWWRRHVDRPTSSYWLIMPWHQIGARSSATTTQTWQQLECHINHTALQNFRNTIILKVMFLICKEDWQHIRFLCYKDYSGYGLSQRGTTVQYNAVPRSLSAHPEWYLFTVGFKQWLRPMVKFGQNTRRWDRTLKSSHHFVISQAAFQQGWRGLPKTNTK